MATIGDAELEAARVERRFCFGASIFCGVAPLTIGSLIYWIWRYTRWDNLPVLGLWTVLFGCVSFIIGVGFLIRLWTVSPRELYVSRRREFWKCGLALAILLVNFPAAAIYALSAVDHMSETLVQIHNESNEEIDSFIVTGPGVKIDVGPIPIGATNRALLEFTGDGTLDFSARQQQRSFEGQLLGYVTGGFGGSIYVMIRTDGKVEVVDNSSSRLGD